MPVIYKEGLESVLWQLGTSQCVDTYIRICLGYRSVSKRCKTGDPLFIRALYSYTFDYFGKTFLLFPEYGPCISKK